MASSRASDNDNLPTPKYHFLGLLQTVEWPAPHFTQLFESDEKGNISTSNTGTFDARLLIISAAVPYSYSIFTDTKGRFTVVIGVGTMTVTFITQSVNLEIGINLPHLIEFRYIDDVFHFSIDHIEVLLKDQSDEICHILSTTLNPDGSLNPSLANKLGYSAGQWETFFSYRNDSIYQVFNINDIFNIRVRNGNRALALGLSCPPLVDARNYSEYNYCILIEADKSYYILENGHIRSGKRTYKEGDVFEIGVIEVNKVKNIVYRHNGNITYSSSRSFNKPLQAYLALRYAQANEIGQLYLGNDHFRKFHRMGAEIESLFKDKIASFISKNNVKSVESFEQNFRDELNRKCEAEYPKLAAEDKSIFSECVYNIAKHFIKTINP